MDLSTLFINNLRRIRKEKNVTQEKLAELCQTETSYIGQIETGKRFPSISLIEKIANALDTPAYIFFMDSEKYADNTDIINISDNICKYVRTEIDKLNKK